LYEEQKDTTNALMYAEEALMYFNILNHNEGTHFKESNACRKKIQSLLFHFNDDAPLEQKILGVWYDDATKQYYQFRSDGTFRYQAALQIPEMEKTLKTKLTTSKGTWSINGKKMVEITEYDFHFDRDFFELMKKTGFKMNEPWVGLGDDKQVSHQIILEITEDKLVAIMANELYTFKRDYPK